MQLEITSAAPKLLPIKPETNCIKLGKKGDITAVLGYLNPSAFERELPIGKLNLFTAGKPDRSQPSSFFPGLNRGAFEVKVDTLSEWRLDGEAARITPKSKVCACPVTDNSAVISSVLSLSGELGLLVFEAAEALRGTSATEARAREASDDAMKRSASAVLKIKAALEPIPKKSESCPVPKPGCKQADHWPALQAAQRQVDELQGMLEKISALSSASASPRDPKRKQRLEEGARLAKQAGDKISSIPRFRSSCEKQPQR